jgi:hypothetical protein
MSRLTRWIIKTSFVYLVLALIAGILLAGGSIWNWSIATVVLYPGYIHLISVGWLTMLIFGVAHWMFPKYSLAHPHGNETLNWAAYILINLGLAMRIVGEPFNNLYRATFWTWFLVLSASLQWLGGTVFIINLWKRVKLK